jgi:hypothetical protein
MKKLAILAAFLCAPALMAGSHIVDQKTFDTIAAEVSGERPLELERRIVEFSRVQASPMMAAVAQEVILPALRDAGVEASIEQFPSDGRTTYQTYISPIGWTMRGGELWLEGEQPLRLCRYSDVPMCVSTYSKGGEWSGELVEVGSGTSDSDYAGKDVRGKVLLASGYARDVVRKGVLQHGAVGAVIYPPTDDRPDHPDMIRYNGLWTRAADAARSTSSFQISANQYAMLKSKMNAGPVRLRGRVDADLGPGQLTVVHAYIRGSETPQDEIIVSAHLDHPKWSANDNGSGSAALVEMARTIQSLIASKKLAQPRRTIHFMWVPEYYGTIAYLTRHPEARACSAFDDPRPKPASASGCVIANINMDMVGEDTVKTAGRFYMTRSPISVPSFLDALLPDVLEQTRQANLFAVAGTRNYWPSEVTRYYQGSDHDLFLGVGIPSSMFGHDPEWTHHTSEDTPDKTDASELRRVTALATNATYWIAAADAAGWQAIAPAVAAERLRADSERLVAMRRLGNARLAADLQTRVTADVALLDSAKLSTRGVLVESADATPASKGPRRLTIPPVFSELLGDATGDDRAWLDQQTRSFPNFDLALYEVVNLMNGSRSTAAIADLLTIELGQPFTAAWVDRAVSLLTARKLAELPR